MKLGEAIKENEATIANKSAYLLPGEIVAIQLGIEAPKYVQYARNITARYLPQPHPPLLPGETKE